MQSALTRSQARTLYLALSAAAAAAAWHCNCCFSLAAEFHASATKERTASVSPAIFFASSSAAARSALTRCGERAGTVSATEHRPGCTARPTVCEPLAAPRAAAALRPSARSVAAAAGGALPVCHRPALLPTRQAPPAPHSRRQRRPARPWPRPRRPGGTQGPAGPEGGGGWPWAGDSGSRKRPPGQADASTERTTGPERRTGLSSSKSSSLGASSSLLSSTVAGAAADAASSRGARQPRIPVCEVAARSRRWVSEAWTRGSAHVAHPTVRSKRAIAGSPCRRSCEAWCAATARCEDGARTRYS